MKRNLVSRRKMVACILGGLALAATSGSSLANPSAGNSNEPRPSLTVSLGLYTVTQPSLFIAKQLGFFEKAGVDVELQVNGTNFATVVLSGRADIAASGPIGAVNTAFRGKDTVVIAELTRGTPNGVVVKADSPYKTIMDLSGGTVAGYAPGTSNYGTVGLLSGYIVGQGGQPLVNKPTSSTSGSFLDLVVSGSVDASIDMPEGATSYIKSGRVKWLISPTDELMTSIMSPDMVGYSIWTARDNIADKREAIVRFIAGLRLASAWIATHSEEEIIAELSKMPGFQQFLESNPSLLTDVVPQVKMFWPTEDGFISQARWDDVTIPVWQNWKGEFDVTSDTASWAQRVDMSYWTEATDLVESLKGSSQ